MTKNPTDTARATILSHASSLLEDANILFNHKKYARAVALAILCIEECGKCKLLDWHGIAGVKTNSSKGFHAKKQNIIASYQTSELFAAELKRITTQLGLEIKHISEPSDWQKKFRESDAGKLSEQLFEEHFVREASRVAEDAWKSSRFLRGEYLKIKNNCLYVDLNNSGDVIATPSEITREDASEVMKQAESALRIVQRYQSSSKT